MYLGGGEKDEGDEDDRDDGLPDPSADPHLILLEGSPFEVEDPRLLAVLAKASPRQQEILALIEEGYDYDEIAALMGISASTVWVQLHKLRKHLTAA